LEDRWNWDAVTWVDSCQPFIELLGERDLNVARFNLLLKAKHTEYYCRTRIHSLPGQGSGQGSFASEITQIYGKYATLSWAQASRISPSTPASSIISYPHPPTHQKHFQKICYSLIYDTMRRLLLSCNWEATRLIARKLTVEVHYLWYTARCRELVSTWPISWLPWALSANILSTPL
jgi:hypothetical protein